ncbi:myosin-IIIb-like isoform X2 [Tubulanus polymorphus]|uniref:myosin-IIIb-like isoform X2 n=1 Tax=Tubulanus polymorphus TaxID=672921 RepID=UPI003DA610D2
MTMEKSNTDDLTTLTNLDDDILLSELKKRYEQNKIYTFVGDILVAINPFKVLPIYDKKVSHCFSGVKKSEASPHIFAIASSAYHALIGQNSPPQNQCILISGESGAGKTESTKFLIKQLIELCHGNNQLEQQILQVNPLLEAFGNAQTLMNNNSSRFGKFIQLKFKEGQVIGAKISEYLLEKSRVIRQSSGEKNFHVFYYMLAGLSSQQLQKFKLSLTGNYSYLSDGISSLRTKFDRLKMYHEDLINAMDLVGFTEIEQEYVFTILASILALGHVCFQTDDNNVVCAIDQVPIKTVAGLLGIDADSLHDHLTHSVTVTRGEQIRRNYSIHQAEDARDAMSKSLYGRLFGWIVNKINHLLAPVEQLPESANEIGILDIFGFEHFKDNSFEQACINLANEQLQYYFNQHVFKLEQEEYIREGVDWTEIKYVDNQPLLNLFLSTPIGILSLLDEESHFPQATDESLVEKLNKNFNHNQYFKAHPNSKQMKFTIFHYAGKVEYSTCGWLEKNRDTLPTGIVDILQESSNQLVNIIFKATMTRTGSLSLQHRTSKGRISRKTRRKKNAPPIIKKKITVGLQFKNSLEAMMERMKSAVPLFIRCIKPNNEKLPNKFDDERVSKQLLYTGMLETTKIRREGFAIRPTFAEFVEKYKILVSKHSLPASSDSCLYILTKSEISGCYIGKTKVFLKYSHLDQLADRQQYLIKAAVIIQKCSRGFLDRRAVMRLRMESEKQALQAATLMSQVGQLSESWFSKQSDLMTMTEVSSLEPSDGEHLELPEFDFPPPPLELLQDDFNVDDLPPPPDEFLVAGDSTSDSDIMEDDFEPPALPPKNYRKFGRQATKIWFKETQANSLQTLDGVYHEWFHGIITRS